MSQIFKFLLVFLIATSIVYSNELTIASLNIRVYGLGGMFSGTPQDEFRDKWLNEYITTQLPHADIITFQEIINKDTLQENVVPHLKCVSYDSTQNQHLYVVLCHKKEYDLIMEENETDYALDTETLGKFRPVVFGSLSHNGKKLAHVLAVHLKALPTGHEIRKIQAKEIAQRIQKFSDNLPVILVGDFNSYVEVGDVEAIGEILQPAGLVHVPTGNLCSYKTPFYKGLFDHVWISSNVTITEPYTVHGPCNETPPQAGEQTRRKPRYENLFFYNQFISDHCPISVKIKLP